MLGLRPCVTFCIPVTNTSSRCFSETICGRKNTGDRLRKDIWSLLENASKPVHFLGPLVCTPAPHFPGSVPAYQLIDGQQRLTTLTLLLAAIRNVAVSRNLRNLAEEISEDYLFHKRKLGTERYKVLPRLGDREALIAIIDGNDLAPYEDSRIYDALKYSHRHAEHWARQRTEEQLRTLYLQLLFARSGQW